MNKKKYTTEIALTKCTEDDKARVIQHVESNNIDSICSAVRAWARSLPPVKTLPEVE